MRQRSSSEAKDSEEESVAEREARAEEARRRCERSEHRSLINNAEGEARSKWREPKPTERLQTCFAAAPEAPARFYLNLLFQLLLCVLLPGTVPITHMQQISPVLYRGSAPSKKDLEKLKAKGIKTIISCRTNPEKSKARYAESLGMNFVHIPTGVFLTPGPKEINKFLSVIHDPANQPAYICCVIGTDRTSAYVAVYRVIDQHYSYEQAIADMKKNHLKPWWYSFRRYKKVVREYIDNPILAKEPID